MNAGYGKRFIYFMAVFLALQLTGLSAKGGGFVSFRIKSHDFTEGGAIPKRFTCEGEDLSPELEWDGAPAGARSFALILDDPDAPMGTFTHWVVYDLPASARRLARGAGNKTVLKDNVKHGHTDFGRTGYGGPCPPKGHGRHRYYFRITALDVETLGLPAGASRNEVLNAMKGHVLAEASTMGVFER